MDSTFDGRRQLRLVLLPVLLLATLVAVWLAVSFYNGWQPLYYGWWPWAPFGWFFIVPLLFIAFFAFFALRFLWWGPWWHGWYSGEDAALLVLRERFARGEITREQFEQMRKDLQGQ